MKKSLKHTKVTVKLRKSEYREEWYLIVESYPIFKPGTTKPGRSIESVNRIIKTPIWDKTSITRINDDGTFNYKPKRDLNGVIQCRSKLDQESCIYADNIRKMRQHEFDTQALYTDQEKELMAQNQRSEQDFVAYFKSVIRTRHPNSSDSIINNWNRVHRLLKLYSKGEPIPFKDISAKWLTNVKMFFLAAPNGSGKGTLSQNTASTYFAILKAGLKQAFIDEYLREDIGARVAGIPKEEVERFALTIEELEKLASTPCEDDVLKRAFLFATLTGIRHSDLKLIKWGQLTQVNGRWRLDFKQKKTKKTDYLPISNQAYELCSTPKEPDRLIFEGLTDSAWISRPLKKWLEAAGITKHITFHSSRHTFATLQLTFGTGVYVIKSMLGHTNVKTTQIYTHIVDKKKEEAADAIYIDALG